MTITKELSALVSLVDEPNEEMFDVIRQKIIGYGNRAIPTLEDAWVDTFSDFGSKRIESIIEDIRQDILITDFTIWAQNKSNNIIDGLIILTKYFQPDFNESRYANMYEKLYRDTWLELNDNLTALEKIKVVNHVFYTVYKFNVGEDVSVNSDTFFFNKILNSRVGNSISLGILYIALVQKLNIPVYGVNLPGHFILAYMDDAHSQLSLDKLNAGDVFFYINAAKAGTAFTRNEIVQYIKHIKIKENSEYFMPCSNLTVLKRMMVELIAVLESENNQQKAKVLKKLLADIHQTNNRPESASI